MPEHPGPDDFSTPHRVSGLKAAGAVLAVAVVPLALVVGHLPDRAASTTVQPAAGGAVSPWARSPSTTVRYRPSASSRRGDPPSHGGAIVRGQDGAVVLGSPEAAQPARLDRGAPSRRPRVVCRRVDRGQGEEERDVLLPGQHAYRRDPRAERGAASAAAFNAPHSCRRRTSTSSSSRARRSSRRRASAMSSSAGSSCGAGRARCPSPPPCRPRPSPVQRCRLRSGLGYGRQLPLGGQRR